MVWVKVCGITKVEDALMVANAGADAIGLVVGFPQSPRNLSIEVARSIRKRISKDLTTVLVTSFHEKGFGMKACECIQPDAVQVYGDVTPEELDAMGIRWKIRPIYADTSRQEALKGWDAILLDKSMGRGIPGDWSAEYEEVSSLNKPIILAGGLNPENVSVVVRKFRPFGVDVSSGVESRPGIKDRAKVLEFVRSAKGVP